MYSIFILDDDCDAGCTSSASESPPISESKPFHQLFYLVLIKCHPRSASTKNIFILSSIIS